MPFSRLPVPPWGFTFLEPHLDAPCGLVRRWAFRQLTANHPEMALDRLSDALRSDQQEIQSLAVEFIGRNQLSRFGFVLHRLFREAEGWLKADCAEALGRLRYEPAIPEITRMFAESEGGDLSLLPGAVEGLVHIGGQRARTALTAYFTNGRWRRHPAALAVRVADALVRLDPAFERPETLRPLALLTSADPVGMMNVWAGIVGATGNGAALGEFHFLLEIEHDAPVSDFVESGDFDLFGVLGSDPTAQWDRLLAEENHPGIRQAMGKALPGLEKALCEARSQERTAGLMRLLRGLCIGRLPALESLAGNRIVSAVALSAFFSLVEELGPGLDEVEWSDHLQRELFFSPEREQAMIRTLAREFDTNTRLRREILDTVENPGMEAPLIRSLSILARLRHPDFFRMIPEFLGSSEVSMIVTSGMLELCRGMGQEIFDALRPLPGSFPPLMYPELLELAEAMPGPSSVAFIAEHWALFREHCPEALAATAESLAAPRLLPLLAEEFHHRGNELFSGAFLIVHELHDPAAGHLIEALQAAERRDAVLQETGRLLLHPERSLSASHRRVTVVCTECSAEFDVGCAEVLVDPEDMSFLLSTCVNCPRCGSHDRYRYAVSTQAALTIEWACLLAERASVRTSGHGMRLAALTIDGQSMGPRRAREYLEAKLAHSEATASDLIRLARVCGLQKAHGAATGYLERALTLEASAVEADYLLGCQARDVGDVVGLLSHFRQVRDRHAAGIAFWGDADREAILRDVEATVGSLAVFPPAHRDPAHRADSNSQYPVPV